MIIKSILSKLFSFSRPVSQDFDTCPECDMILEDTEACNYCDWTSRENN